MKMSPGFSKNFVLLCALSAIYLDGASSVSVPTISMVGGGNFAQLHSHSSLLCEHALEEGEVLQKLGWFRAGVPVLTWTPPDAPVPSVEYQEQLDLTGGNGSSLVFSKVSVDAAGSYTCLVQSGSGQQESSEEYNLAVADVPSTGFTMHGNVADCVLHFSFNSPPIYPKPTPLCGVWATDTKYTGTATDWQAVPYYNGSVAYSIVDTTFPVRAMPLQAGIRCEMSFPPSAAAAANSSPGDDGRIIAWTNTAYYPQVSERGCPPLDVGDGISVHYTNHRTTCRGELTLQDSTKQLVAMITCMPGTKSSLRGGGLSTLQLRCANGQWEPVGGISWDEFEDMECTEDPNAPQTDSGSEKEMSSDLQEEEEPVAEPEGGSATTAAPATTLLLLLPVLARLLAL